MTTILTILVRGDITVTTAPETQVSFKIVDHLLDAQSKIKSMEL